MSEDTNENNLIANLTRGMNEEEQARFVQEANDALQGARAKILAERSAANLAKLDAEYHAELSKIVQDRSIQHSDKLHDISDLKRKYLAKGLQVF